MPNGKKKKGHKMATHQRKKRLRKNRHTSQSIPLRPWPCFVRSSVMGRVNVSTEGPLTRPFYLSDTAILHKQSDKPSSLRTIKEKEK